jgi:ferredoxin
MEDVRRVKRRRYRIQIDPIRCDGYGYCVELMPELLSFDDWGFPMVNQRMVSTADELDLARRVEHLCPRLAFRLLREPKPRQ